MQHLDMLILRGRRSGREEEVWKSKSDEEFDFGTTEEAEDGYRGNDQRNEPKLKPTEQGRGKAKKAMKAKTKTWSDVVKGLEEDESETADSEEPNQLKVKQG